MRLFIHASGALTVLSLTCLGCGVGTYHIPNVEPVVQPEPEEDIFADLDLEDEGEATEPEEKAPEGGEPAAEPEPAEGGGDAKAAPAEEAAKPAEPTKPAEPAKAAAPKKK